MGPHRALPVPPPLTGGKWSWSWRFGTGSPGRPSSTATPGRARGPGLIGVKENAGGGSPAHPGQPRSPSFPTSLNPASPRQDTDDDRHSRRHLPNLLVSLHDLLDPRLGREHRVRTPSPSPLNSVLGAERRGIPEKGGGGVASGPPNPTMRPPPQPGPGLSRVGPAPPGAGHVLTGGNRALYFFFLLGISGPP